MINRWGMLCIPTWWRAVHAVSRLQQPAGPPRWCTGSSSTRSPSPEQTWCLRSPVTGRQWCSHIKTAAARRRTARWAGCDSARVQPHTAGKRRSQQPSTSSLPRLQPPRFLPAAVPVRLHLNARRVVYGMAAVWLIFLQMIRGNKHFHTTLQNDAQQPLRSPLQVLESNVKTVRNTIMELPAKIFQNKFPFGDVLQWTVIVFVQCSVSSIDIFRSFHC